MAHKAVEIGSWTRPHPTPPPNNPALAISTVLYERPPEEAKPQSVRVDWIDEENVPQHKFVPFHDPIVGAGETCQGCGEPFGVQLKIRPTEWVSVPCVAYDTDKGRMKFCQDVYACSRRAAERVPAAQSQMVTTAISDFMEVTGGAVPSGSRVCENPKCMKVFLPTKSTQHYHTSACRDEAGAARQAARHAASKADKRKRVVTAS